jgi:DNA-binding MltR family transcriptional regulator
MNTPAPQSMGLIERVSRAIRSATEDRLLKEAADIDLRPSEFYQFYKEIQSEPDRSLAIVSFSYIDDRLREAFSLNLNPGITGNIKSLMGPLGPLGTSGSLVQMAAGLYWIQDETYQSLGLLRKIRNEFAHKPFSKGFEDTKINGLLSSMPRIENRLIAVSPQEFIASSSMTQRERFLVRSIMACYSSLAELSYAPMAQRMGLHPMATIGLEQHRKPETLKQLSHAASELVVELLSVRKGGGDEKEKA